MRNNDASAALEPYNGRCLDLEIDFDSRVIGRQRMIFDWTPAQYYEDVSRARTFGFVRDAKILRQAGYALGSSLDNSITVHEDRILNPAACATRTSSSATSCSTRSATSRCAACRSMAGSAPTRAATPSMHWCCRGLFASEANYEIVSAEDLPLAFDALDDMPEGVTVHTHLRQVG